MTNNTRIPLNQQGTTDIPVVAVVLACGHTSLFPELGNIKCKALLPFRGRPVVDYVSIALCHSQVEKVFIVHQQDEDLQKAISPHEKIILVKSNRPQPTIVDSVMSGMEKLFEFFGENNIHPRHILVVPCDIPLVTSRDFDALINQAAKSDADFYFTVIRNSLLKKEYAERRFRTIHLNEWGDNYSPQSTNVIHSRLFRTTQANNNSPYRVEICDNQGRSLNSLFKAGQDIRDHRHSVLGWGRFAYRIAGKGSAVLFLQILFDLLRNRVTESKLVQAIYLTLCVKMRFIESHSTTFSVDIDNPVDLENISRKAISSPENVGNIQLSGKRI